MKRTYQFGPDQVAAIDRLSEELGIDKTDVLRNGLWLLRLAVVEEKKGNALGIIGSGGVSRLVGAWSGRE